MSSPRVQAAGWQEDAFENVRMAEGVACAIPRLRSDVRWDAQVVRRAGAAAAARGRPTRHGADGAATK